MLKKRLLASLMVKNGILVQSIGFSRHLPVGKVGPQLEKVAAWDIDEILLINIDHYASNKSWDPDELKDLTANCFVPLTIGGGIRDIDQVLRLLAAGADKVMINTEIYRRPDLAREISRHCGRQCLVAGVDYRNTSIGKEVFVESGQSGTGVKVEDWCCELENMGVGEIFLQCMERDGSGVGFDIETIGRVAEIVNVPVIAGGGAGNNKHIADCLIKTSTSAVAVGNLFHHTEHSTIKAKRVACSKGIDVRINRTINYSASVFDETGRIVVDSSASEEVS